MFAWGSEAECVADRDLGRGRDRCRARSGLGDRLGTPRSAGAETGCHLACPRRAFVPPARARCSRAGGRSGRASARRAPLVERCSRIERGVRDWARSGPTPDTLTRFLRLTANVSVPRALAALPTFLRDEWGLERRSQVPLAMLRKSAATISGAARALGNRSRGDQATLGSGMRERASAKE